MMINAFVSILLSVCPFQEENDPALLCARQMMDAEFEVNRHPLRHQITDTDQSI